MERKATEELKAAGFKGFIPVSELREGGSKMIPNVPVAELVANWVDGTLVVYIGKATSLRKRISQYIRFGQGKPVGHWGGRYIWQLADASQLLFCWKEVDGDPEAVETEMINAFRDCYGGRPFANLAK